MLLIRGQWPIVAKKKDRKGSKEDTGMDFLTKAYVKVREEARGQTMTEYALILSAVAVVVFVAYQTMGNSINTLLTAVDTKL